MAARVHLALLLVVCANQSFAQGIMANHPLVGRWVWTLPHNNCTEDHTFTADGRMVGTSGKEESEDQITEAVPPNERGGYKITARSVRDYWWPGLCELNGGQHRQILDHVCLLQSIKADALEVL